MQQKNEDIITLFNSWASNGRSDRMAEGHRSSVKKMLSLIKNETNYSLLDIGCGNGWTVREVAQQGHCQLAVGVDISDKMIALALERKCNQKQQFYCGDFVTLEFNTQFDVIISMETFYYIHPTHTALKKAYEMLADNGAIIVGIDYYKENEASHTWPEMVGLNMQLESIDEWNNLFRDVGFKKTHIEQIKDPFSTESWKNDNGTLVIKANK